MAERGAWTVEQANAALPEVRRLLAEARAHTARLRDLEEQLDDLRIVWGDAVLSPACAGHEEFAGYYNEFTSRKDALHHVLLRFHALGAEVKDVEQGLVDFRGLVGTEPAYLCWRDPEPAVAHWHPLDGGFGARRPIP